MNIRKILSGIEYKGTIKDFTVDFITDDSRKIREGCIFVCSKGNSFDGHSYANEAIKKGAKLLVCEYDTGNKNQIIVENSRKVYALMCANLFNNPSRKLKIIGVTGTNGKTTVSFLIKDMLEQMGKKVGLLGTVQNMIDQQIIPAKFTTPQAYDLHALFSQMLKSGCEYVVMEVSSQGLVQNRLHGVDFEVGVFTNLSVDHLDYHETMDKYFDAKCMLFKNSKNIIVNYDDEYGKKIIEKFKKKKVFSFSSKTDEADFTAKQIEYTQNSTKFLFLGKGSIQRVQFPMPGEYSAYNAMSAALSIYSLGIGFKNAAKALENVRGVKGRCEILVKNPFTVIRDYAHTSDGLENVLSSLRPFIKGKFYVLFGCAGDRDKSKRGPMAVSAAKYADFIIVSSDNPRSENPQGILDETCQYFKENNIPYLSEIDRRKAINLSLDMLQYDDVLILCGKGHEDYQVLNGITVYLDEEMIVEKYMKNYKFKEVD